MSDGRWAMSDEVRPHYKLETWKESITLVKAVHKATQNFPRRKPTDWLRKCEGRLFQFRAILQKGPRELAVGNSLNFSTLREGR
jgi:hypothetical protein